MNKKVEECNRLHPRPPKIKDELKCLDGFLLEKPEEKLLIEYSFGIWKIIPVCP